MPRTSPTNRPGWAVSDAVGPYFRGPRIDDCPVRRCLSGARPEQPIHSTLAGANAHAREMHRLFPDGNQSSQATPRLIPKLEIDPDPSGAVATLQPNGPTITAKNAFFQDLGTNGRTCFTCHQPQDGWTISAEHARDRFSADPDDPLFRLVDGATCPSDDVSTPRGEADGLQPAAGQGLDPDRAADAGRGAVPDPQCQRSL